MKYFCQLGCIMVLAGCAQTVASNEKSITIKAGSTAVGKAQELADTHCKQYGKTAVPDGQIAFNNLVYRCE